MKIKITKEQWLEAGQKSGWLKTTTADFTPFPPATYQYYINLNERGSFYADVRNQNGNTVFEIKAGNELGPDESSIFEDGFMKNIHDMDGLKAYLVSLGVMKPNQTLKDMQPHER